MQDTPPPIDQTEPDPRRWITLTVLLIAGFMNLTDVTIVNVAIPSLKRELGASSAEIEWVVAIYIMAFALGLLPFGRLGDVIGRKRMFLSGVFGFTLFSALCGLAPNIEILVVSRAFQGLSASMMMPQVMALAQVIFPPHERNFAFSFFGVANSTASVAGPLVGGSLIGMNIFDLSWRPIFLINVPVGIFAILAGAILLKPAPRGQRRAPVDIVGILLGAATIFAIVFPLVEGREVGWPLWSFASMAVSPLLAALFLAWEHRRAARGETQLVPVDLLGNRQFRVALAMVCVLFAGPSSFMFLIAIFLQMGFGFTPFHSGLTTIPFPAGVLVASLIAGQFGQRYVKTRLIIGPLIIASAMAALFVIVSGLGSELSSLTLALPLFVGGFGMGSTTAPFFPTAMSVAQGRDAGSAAGTIQTFQQMGLAFGIALNGQIFFGTLGSGTSPAAYSAAMEASLAYVAVAMLFLALLASRLQLAPPAQAAGPAEGAAHSLGE
ncbi:MFS transporter [Consotaella salsifontis]|uniref:Drug resistance transporter, EmrB/QacA subfamily n=1 Tax=Consotaella salsifontis TaxID=1365950 RepID=A0A1T4NNU1_9HYPH|nr:MFS transporter [Consotaella salsifontis]SJZ80775.1 drug resistance transporter, EmrB/QacA subfamily [Consotaella salsifontis]